MLYPIDFLMATIKIVLRKKQRKDGKYPLAICIIKDRNPSYINLGQNINESEWDAVKQRVKKSHPNSTRLNNYIQKKLADTTDKLLELEIHNSNISFKAIRKGLRPSPHATFFSQATIYVDNLKKSGKYNRISTERSRVNRFKEFLKGEDLSFQDISVSLLKQFQAYLKGTWKNSQRSVVNDLVVIRSIFNQAIKDGLVDRKYYPFGKDKIQIKFPDSVRVGLSIEEVKKIEALELESGSYLNHARNIWLISFYFAGMRVSDVLRLKWSDFQNERLHYAMGKNAKAGSLKLPAKASKILLEYEHLKKSNNALVFPDLKMVADFSNLYDVQKWIKNAIKKLDKTLPKIAELAGIEKKLTMHIARHTFGNISGDKIPIQMLQKLYRHTSITTTIAYQANFIHRDSDEALDAVIDF